MTLLIIFMVIVTVCMAYTALVPTSPAQKDSLPSAPSAEETAKRKEDSAAMRKEYLAAKRKEDLVAKRKEDSAAMRKEYLERLARVQERELEALRLENAIYKDACYKGLANGKVNEKFLKGEFPWYDAHGTTSRVLNRMLREGVIRPDHWSTPGKFLLTKQELDEKFKEQQGDNI